MSDGRRPRISLALSSGGAGGFAHVGVIRVLEAAGLDIVAVAGSSIGGIMAAGYALRGDVAELERWVLDFRPHFYLRGALPLLEARRIRALFDQLTGRAGFSDCAVPLTVIATDLERRAPAALSRGSVSRAAFATMAVPPVHRPVQWEGRLLAEGALSCSLPLAQAARADVDLIVGSTVSRRRRFNPLMPQVSMRVGRLIWGWRRTALPDADREPEPPVHGSAPATAAPAIVITPAIDRIGLFDFHKAPEAIAAGEEATLAHLDIIRALLGVAARQREGQETAPARLVA